jgi:hypothetical protein
MAGLVVARAEEKKAAEEAKPKMAKLVQPWSKLTSLSDDQKTKIREIRAKANAECKAIRDKEEADCVAVLNDEQKAELEKLKAEAKKAASADEPAKKEPAGQ